MVSGQAEIQREWAARAAEEGAIQHVMATASCPRGIAHLLVSRGFTDEAAVKSFFSPSLDDLIDPMRMLGMDAAVERIRRAVRSSEPILIYGDYDVDGTTATVLLKTAIERSATKENPAIVRYHVPHRIREGYGMRTGVLADAAASGVRLVISVDTGIRAFAAASEARALGLDLIVTDHHLPDDAQGVPDALAVINPVQDGCTYPFKGLCGAAVAFKLAHAILRAACLNDHERHRLERTLIPSFLKLVAIATIADSVPLEGENRVIASLGLRELRNPVQPGLRALMEIAQIPLDRPPTATEVGFRIAPRINAAGRMDVASDVVDLFLTRDPEQARDLAAKLNRLNDDRKVTEARALEAIDEELSGMQRKQGQFPAICLVMDDPAWHRGVLGILASRIVDRTGRPALVLTHEDGQAHGSGRSIPGYHLLDALTSVHDEDRALFARFGGHAHAVGFSLPSERVELLRERMEHHSAAILLQEMLAPPLEYDAEVSLEELSGRFHEWLERCGPFGVGNREPVFITRSVRLASSVRVIKDRHVCLEINSGDIRLRALGWSRSGMLWTELCQRMQLDVGSRIDIAYRLKAKSNPWYTGLELELVDLRLSESPATA
ncbi:single-stranded-DNA-specific exonuclease RecJ [Edaphobacter modestus]|uniref:Single-stranded-DNA-specific exonuclease RecJ n=1 Tax=Edaphobacter modestus TaxID=388466 RepID=A0A4Q7YZT7_9BACT|nr:single-stranded-DNA-specific exonuclease RecJ [Edaphobacter modestus]RZU43512.1 exonuclease RecJ [Edaphobacter modestus]